MTRRKMLVYTICSLLLVLMILITLYPDKPDPARYSFFVLFLDVGVLCLSASWVLKCLSGYVLAPWYNVRTQRQRVAQQGYHPLVSVLIPAYNEAVGLTTTVKTVLASTYRPLEVVIVNDGSTDDSDARMRTFLQKYQRAQQHLPDQSSVVYHYQTNGGKGKALNSAILLSHGDLLVTIDADCAMHQDAVQAFVNTFADASVMASSGTIRISNTRTVIGVVQSLEYILAFYLKKSEALLGIILVLGGACSAFRRSVFDTIGGYDSTMLTEDMDLSLRLQAAGMRLLYTPDAVVHTEGPSTLSGFLKQRIRWKRGRIEAFDRYKDEKFTLRKGPNRLFFWTAFPFVVVEDVQNVLGLFILAMVYVYGLLTLDFTGLLAMCLLLMLMCCIALWDDRHYRHLGTFALSPLLFFLLHILYVIEMVALCYAYWSFFTHKEVRWQQWQRAGVR